MPCTKIIDKKKVNDERRNKAKKIPEKEKNSKRKTIMLEAKGLGFRQLTTTWWLRIFEYKKCSWSYSFQNKPRFGKAVLLLNLALDSPWFTTHWAGFQEIFWRNGGGSAGCLWCYEMDGDDEVSSGCRSPSVKRLRKLWLYFTLKTAANWRKGGQDKDRGRFDQQKFRDLKYYAHTQI